MEKTKKYVVAGFPSDKSVEVIPATWMIGENACYWPSKKDRKNIKNLIQKCEPPLTTWPQLSMTIYGRSNSYSRASQKCEEARYSSHIDSDSSDSDKMSQKRQTRLPVRFQTEKASDEEQSQSLINSALIKTTQKNVTSTKNKRYTLPVPPPDNNISNAEDNQNLEIMQPCFSKESTCTESERVLHSVVDETPAFKTKETQNQNLELSSLQTLTSDEPFPQKLLKLLLALQQDNKVMKYEIKKLREAVELSLQQKENPEVVATIKGIVAEEFPNLPLMTLSDLNNLEQLVSKNSSKATSLARFLCRGSGFANANILTLQIMKRLLGREFAMKFSLEGRQGKQKFSEFSLFLVVIASVKMKFQDVDSNTISSRIGKVLAGAADWDGNRIRNRRKKIKESSDTLHFDTDSNI